MMRMFGGLTTEQKADLAWVDGFRARMMGWPRPESGPSRMQGWDHADRLLESTPGGYGLPEGG